jgi:biopolymer transport protein ExbB
MQQDAATTLPADQTAASAVNSAEQAPGFAGASDADALSQMGFSHLFQEMVAKPGEFVVSWVVLITLVVMSVGSWYYTIVNFLKNSVVRARAERVIRTFWDTPNPAEAIRLMEEQPKKEPFSKVALEAAQAALHHQRSEGSRLAESLSRSEFIDRALRQAVTRESARLESGQTWLATSGSTAPFVGLLGTVWGIYGALIRIGATGQASIDAVAGPVGEALIMTALGLFVAIPAVIAFNAFVRVNSQTNARFDAFAHDLHDFFATGARVGDAAPKR